MAGVWEDDRDPLMNAVVLLVMYAKRRHRPLVNLHNLAKAVEYGDMASAQKFYAGLAQEVSRTLPKYPDIVGTLETMSQMTEEQFDLIDGAMQAAHDQRR
jgi:hypothetical protein